MLRKEPVKGEKALEMRMRDTLDGMFDSATYFAYRSCPNTVQILSIEPPKPIHLSPSRPAQVVNVKTATTVTEFLPSQELQLERLPS